MTLARAPQAPAPRSAPRRSRWRSRERVVDGGSRRAPQAPHAPGPGGAVALRERLRSRLADGDRCFLDVLARGAGLHQDGGGLTALHVLAAFAPRSRTRRLSPRTFFVPALAMVSSSCCCEIGSFCCRLPWQVPFQSPARGKRTRFLIWRRPVRGPCRASCSGKPRRRTAGRAGCPNATMRYTSLSTPRCWAWIEKRARPRQRPLRIRRAS